MSVLHLDTNVLVYSLNPAHRAREQIRAWQQAGMQFTVSAMVWAEFLCGPVTAASAHAWQRLLAGRIVGMDARVAERAAVLFNQTGRRARSLPDCVIAATALLAGTKLATYNQADFACFNAHGLQLLGE